MGGKRRDRLAGNIIVAESPAAANHGQNHQGSFNENPALGAQKALTQTRHQLQSRHTRRRLFVGILAKSASCSKPGKSSEFGNAAEFCNLRPNRGLGRARKAEKSRWQLADAQPCGRRRTQSTLRRCADVTMQPARADRSSFGSKREIFAKSLTLITVAIRFTLGY